jgi:large subunit ribosomal protein L15
MDLKTVCNKGTKYGARQRVGRGIGSGSGKTCGRGHKGRGARSGASRRPGYEGGQMPIYRRVPKRGFTNARFRKEYTVINVDKLNDFADGDTVDLTAVLEHGLVSMNTPMLKVLGNGDLSRKLTVHAQKFSGSARSKIEAAGGSAIELNDKGQEASQETSPEASKAPTKKAAPKEEAAEQEPTPAETDEAPPEEPAEEDKGQD